MVLIFSSLFIFSPKPTAFLINQLFKGGVAVPPPHYEEIQQQTVSRQNITYPSQFSANQLDIIQPKNSTQKPFPTIFWMHGGAFVGGDKSDVTEYAVQIANEGYTVVNINYELAPSASYPTPLHQLAEVVQFIESSATEYNIDFNQLYFAGDSAGAQLVSQFALIQVDPAYAQKVGIQPVTPLHAIKGLLLFCGPYDITQFTEMGDNVLVHFLLKRIGWAYLGEINWKQSEDVKNASIIEQVNEKFPATFITDGNVNSFELQGKALASKLKDQHVFVDDVFYPLKEAQLEHEYQFKMNTPEALQTFERMIDFLAFTQN